MKNLTFTKTNLSPCSPNPCKNNGTCIQISNFYLCNCDQTAGFSGLNCEKLALNNETIETTEIITSSATITAEYTIKWKMERWGRDKKKSYFSKITSQDPVEQLTVTKFVLQDEQE